MASWEEFVAAAPAEVGEFGTALLFQHDVGLGYLSTIRFDDGGPRVHPVCPFVGDGRLFVVVPRTSPKSRDLRADGRYMLHAFPADRDAEFSIRGRARLVTDPAERAVAERAVSFASGVGSYDDVFVLDIERADATTWENWAQADTYAVRRRWVVS
jgi:hypothetical protein